MNTLDANDLLVKMSNMAAEAGGERNLRQPGTEAEGFARILAASIDDVNQSTLKSRQLATDYELGGKDIDLAEVMIASQTASLKFNAMVQVRNRLVAAYQEIMSMPI